MSMTVEDMKNIIITFVNIAEEQLEEKSFREMDDAGTEILKALDELEQYESIGTVKVFETVIKSQMDYFYQLREYEKIGTVSEFRELKEKATERYFEEDAPDGYGHTCTNKTCAERIRAKAIEEFAEALRQECLNNVYHEVWLHTILKIAKELKGE